MANVDIADYMTRRIAPSRKRQAMDSVAYRLIFSVCFIVFFWAMALERLVPQTWRTLSEVPTRKSLWMSAKEAAQICTSIAFQG
jgi:hypothetical protein